VLPLLPPHDQPFFIGEILSKSELKKKRKRSDHGGFQSLEVRKNNKNCKKITFDL